MKKKFCVFLLILILFSSFVSAEPVLEILIDDNWIYESSGLSYYYTVVGREDFKQDDDEWVELNKMDTNWSYTLPQLETYFLSYVGNETLFDYEFSDIQTKQLYHTSRGNFLVFMELQAQARINFTIDDTLELGPYEGLANISLTYDTMDLQEPLVTGNPIYVERILRITFPTNLTYRDDIVYRIDGTDEYTTNYKGTETTVRNLTIEPKEHYFSVSGGTYPFGFWRRPISIIGLEYQEWVFAKDIGLPISYVIYEVESSGFTFQKTALEKYFLSDFSIFFSDFEESSTEETNSTDGTDETTFILLATISTLMLATIVKKKKQINN